MSKTNHSIVEACTELKNTLPTASEFTRHIELITSSMVTSPNYEHISASDKLQINHTLFRVLDFIQKTESKPIVQSV